MAKNGPAFEERIKREHRDKPKFSFLFSGDPFNAYYQHKVNDIRAQILSESESRATDESSQPQKEDSTEANKQSAETDQESLESHSQDTARPAAPIGLQEPLNGSTSEDHDTDQIKPLAVQHDGDHQDGDHDSELSQKPKVRLKLNEYIQEMTMKFEEPPPLNYLAVSAPSLTSLDCDVIKLTAQFTSLYGRSFLMELVSREQNNVLFDFLKPQHGQFSYLTNLIMQYALIQNQPLDLLEHLSKDASSQKHVLDKVKMRAEWNKMLEIEQRKREEAEEKEKLLYSQIDWHDFVIVETIDYQPGEKAEYPPTTADQVGTRLLIQQRYEEQNVPEEMDIDMDVESDQEDEPEDANGGFVIPEALPPLGDKIPIRKDYDPKAASKAASQLDNYFVSPITNERIPVDKIHEHVRFNLSDPKYLEKKDQMLQERINGQTVFASGSQIQNSLKSLAERRTDIFGMNDEETAIGQRIGEDGKVQSKDDRLIWDGHKSSLKKKKLS